MRVGLQQRYGRTPATRLLDGEDRGQPAVPEGQPRVSGAGRTPQSLLEELDEAILALDLPRTTAIANAYLKSGADRRAYMMQVAITACKLHNSTHLRGRLLLAAPRLLAGWPKMPGERSAMRAS